MEVPNNVATDGYQAYPQLPPITQDNAEFIKIGDFV